MPPTSHVLEKPARFIAGVRQMRAMPASLTNMGAASVSMKRVVRERIGRASDSTSAATCCRDR